MGRRGVVAITGVGASDVAGAEVGAHAGAPPPCAGVGAGQVERAEVGAGAGRGTSASESGIGGARLTGVGAGLILPRRPQYASAPGPIGCKHPDRDRGSRERARWTEPEVSYIGNFVARDAILHPDRGTVVARCLKAIHKDPCAREIFHPNHIVDSGRLRTGYEKVLKLKRESIGVETAEEDVVSGAEDNTDFESLYLNFEGDIFEV